MGEILAIFKNSLYLCTQKIVLVNRKATLTVVLLCRLSGAVSVYDGSSALAKIFQQNFMNLKISAIFLW